MLQNSQFITNIYVRVRKQQVYVYHNQMISINQCFEITIKYNH